MTIPADIVTPADYAAYAQQRLPPGVWDYFHGGAGDEATLAENGLAYGRWRLRPRVLRDLRGATTALTLFDTLLTFPVLLAPVAYQKLAHPLGELASAAAVAAMGAGMVLSTQATADLNEVARTPDLRAWFQLYWQHDRQFNLDLVRRVEDAGYRALVLTVDAPVSGIRLRERRSGFHPPADLVAVNLQGLPPLPPQQSPVGGSPLFGGALLNHAPTWDQVAALCAATRLPVLLKGILDPADAELGLKAGAAGLIVSNHGGRMLDGAPASLDALPAVAAAVAGRVPVLLDGGIRQGTDVFKALALGAQAVLIGRPAVYALAVAGAPGVAHVLHMLRAELETVMALAGCPTLAAIGPEALWESVPG